MRLYCRWPRPWVHAVERMVAMQPPSTPMNFHGKGLFGTEDFFECVEEMLPEQDPIIVPIRVPASSDDEDGEQEVEEDPDAAPVSPNSPAAAAGRRTRTASSVRRRPA